VQPGVVYTTFHFPDSGANVITTENSDWATNCPEYKVTAVQAVKSSGLPTGSAASTSSTSSNLDCCAARPPRRSRSSDAGAGAMKVETLVTMANQIADFFVAESGTDAAPHEIAVHITKFWAPPMRTQIIAHAAAGGDGLQRRRWPPSICCSLRS
jgi:hypothetical protein